MNLLGLSLPLHILFSCSFTFSPFNHFRPLSMAIMKMKDSDLALCKQNVYWTCNVCFHAPVIILSKHFFSPAELALINNTSMLEVLFALSRYWMGISFDNTKPQHEVDEGREQKKALVKLINGTFHHRMSWAVPSWCAPWWIKYVP